MVSFACKNNPLGFFDEVEERKVQRRRSWARPLRERNNNNLINWLTGENCPAASTRVAGLIVLGGLLSAGDGSAPRQ